MDKLLTYAREIPAFSVLSQSRLPIADTNILLTIIAYDIQWTDETMQELAKEGNLPVMKWARENGCSWNSNTCSLAAMNGHLECLKWLRSNPSDPCPWNLNTCAWAAEKWTH